MRGACEGHARAGRHQRLPGINVRPAARFRSPSVSPVTRHGVTRKPRIPGSNNERHEAPTPATSPASATNPTGTPAVAAGRRAGGSGERGPPTIVPRSPADVPDETYQMRGRSRSRSRACSRRDRRGNPRPVPSGASAGSRSPGTAGRDTLSPKRQGDHRPYNTDSFAPVRFNLSSNVHLPFRIEAICVRFSSLPSGSTRSIASPHPVEVVQGQEVSAR
jgi:hypothetical protein